MEKLRSDIGDMDESYKSFRHSHWAFSKVALNHSISVMNDAESEDTALHIFQSILAYSGLLEQGKNSGHILKAICVLFKFLIRTLKGISRSLVVLVNIH